MLLVVVGFNWVFLDTPCLLRDARGLCFQKLLNGMWPIKLHADHAVRRLLALWGNVIEPSLASRLGGAPSAIPQKSITLDADVPGAAKPPTGRRVTGKPVRGGRLRKGQPSQSTPRWSLCSCVSRCCCGEMLTAYGVMLQWPLLSVSRCLWRQRRLPVVGWHEDAVPHQMPCIWRVSTTMPVTVVVSLSQSHSPWKPLEHGPAPGCVPLSPSLRKQHEAVGYCLLLYATRG
jgi:hypothetical protein